MFSKNNFNHKFLKNQKFVESDQFAVLMVQNGSGPKPRRSIISMNLKLDNPPKKCLVKIKCQRFWTKMSSILLSKSMLYGTYLHSISVGIIETGTKILAESFGAFGPSLTCTCMQGVGQK